MNRAINILGKSAVAPYTGVTRISSVRELGTMGMRDAYRAAKRKVPLKYKLYGGYIEDVDPWKVIVPTVQAWGFVKRVTRSKYIPPWSFCSAFVLSACFRYGRCFETHDGCTLAHSISAVATRTSRSCCCPCTFLLRSPLALRFWSPWPRAKNSSTILRNSQRSVSALAPPVTPQHRAYSSKLRLFRSARVGYVQSKGCAYRVQYAVVQAASLVSEHIAHKTESSFGVAVLALAFGSSSAFAAFGSFIESVRARSESSLVLAVDGTVAAAGGVISFRHAASLVFVQRFRRYSNSASSSPPLSNFLTRRILAPLGSFAASFFALSKTDSALFPESRIAQASTHS
jgi:hypothetical protein